MLFTGFKVYTARSVSNLPQILSKSSGLRNCLAAFLIFLSAYSLVPFEEAIAETDLGLQYLSESTLNKLEQIDQSFHSSWESLEDSPAMTKEVSLTLELANIVTTKLKTAGNKKLLASIERKMKLVQITWSEILEFREYKKDRSKYLAGES